MNTPPAALIALHHIAIALAGDDYLWTHPDAPKTMNSAHKRGLMAIMVDMQLGLCAACGDPLEGERYDYCHIVACRTSEGGRTAGNGYIGHVGCNSDDSKVFGNGIVPLESLVRADLVPTVYPTRAECLKRDKDVTDARAARRARRMARVA